MSIRSDSSRSVTMAVETTVVEVEMVRAVAKLHNRVSRGCEWVAARAQLGWAPTVNREDLVRTRRQRDR